MSNKTIPCTAPTINGVCVLHPESDCGEKPRPVNPELASFVRRDALARDAWKGGER